MMQSTGTIDRWMEQIIESSYGQVGARLTLPFRRDECWGQGLSIAAADTLSIIPGWPPEASHVQMSNQIIMDACVHEAGKHLTLTPSNRLTLLQVSFSPQVDVTPTLWVPYDNPSGSPFLYNDLPTHPFLAQQVRPGKKGSAHSG